MAHVLVIAPHMDDEVLGCGGAIARHVDEGNKDWLSDHKLVALVEKAS